MASSNSARSKPHATECTVSGTLNGNAAAVPSKMFKPSNRPSQINSRRVGFMVSSLAGCWDLVQQLLEHLVDLQPIDVQFWCNAYPMAQYRQSAALDVIRGDELAAA